jgi:hypothetical protein
VNRKYHSCIAFSSQRESFDVVIQNILPSRTLDLNERNLTSGRVLGFNVILKKLRAMNIHRGSLFPGLDGLGTLLRLDLELKDRD